MVGKQKTLGSEETAHSGRLSANALNCLRVVTRAMPRDGSTGLALGVISVGCLDRGGWQ